VKSTINGKQSKGYAMVTVILFITVFVILGMSLLLLSQQNVKQSTEAYLTDKAYYAAESAAQVAAQELISELMKEENKDIFSNVDTTNANEIKTVIQALFNSKTKDAIKAGNPSGDSLFDYNFNGVDGLYEDLNIEFDPAGQTKTFNIILQAKAGGRNVSLIIPASLSKTPASGAHYNSLSAKMLTVDSIYNDGKTAAEKQSTYDDYIARITAEYNNQKNKSASVLSTISGMTASKVYTAKEVNDLVPGSSAYNTFISQEYIHIEQAFTGSSYHRDAKLPQGNYQNLKYIFCDDYCNLILEGDYNFKAIKAIRIGGNSKRGFLDIRNNTRLLEIPSEGCMIDTLTIYINAYPYQSTANGVIVMNNCRVIASNVNLNYNSGKFESNSVFFSTSLNLRGPVSNDLTNVFPQFYHMNTGTPSLWKIDNFNGILTTLSKTGVSILDRPADHGDDGMVKNGVLEAKINGLIIGCLYQDGNATPIKKKQAGNNYIGIGDFLPQGGEGYSLDWLANGRIEFKDQLTLRETTGEPISTP
jgi:hypothetical protein